jgi:ABC-2 type transport system permease protein
MKKLIYYEWLHFIRNAARPIAVLLFLLAAGFSLINGISIYQERLDQIEKINLEIANTHSEVAEWFASESYGPEGRPWVDVSTPFWPM